VIEFAFSAPPRYMRTAAQIFQSLRKDKSRLVEGGSWATAPPSSLSRARRRALSSALKKVQSSGKGTMKKKDMKLMRIVIHPSIMKILHLVSLAAGSSQSVSATYHLHALYPETPSIFANSEDRKPLKAPAHIPALKKTT
jgi:hypothetical protein